MVALDYANLTETALGFTPPPRTPLIPPPRPHPSYTPQQLASLNPSPSGSGYNTPHYGLGAPPPASLQASMGTSAFAGRGRGRGAFQSLRGQGTSQSGRGASRSSAAGGQVMPFPVALPHLASPGVGLTDRPLLRPVKFVRAALLPSTLGADPTEELKSLREEIHLPSESIEKMAVAGVEQVEVSAATIQVETTEMVATEVNTVYGIKADGHIPYEPPTTAAITPSSNVLLTPHLTPSERTGPLARPSISPLAEDTGRRSEDDSTAAVSAPVVSSSSPGPGPVVVPPNFVLGLPYPTSAQPASSPSSDGEDDEVVFQPPQPLPNLTSLPLSHNISESVSSPSALGLIPERVDDRPASPASQQQKKKLSSSQKRALKIAGKKARKKGVQHARSLPVAAGVARLHLQSDDDVDLGSEEEEAMERASEAGVVKDHGKIMTKRQRKRFEAKRERREEERAELEDYMQNVTMNDPTTFSGPSTSQGRIDELDQPDEDPEGWETSDEEDESIDEGDEVERDHLLGEADARAELFAIVQGGSSATEGSDQEGFEDQDEDKTGPSISDLEPLDIVPSSEEEEAVIQRLQAETIEAGGGRNAAASSTGSYPRKKKSAQGNRKGRGKEKVESETSDDSDDDDDDDLGEGGYSWADKDEEAIQALMDANPNILRGGKDNRKQRAALFRAIENGDFRDVDFDDDHIMFDEEDDFIVHGRRKQKGKPTFTGNFAGSLQAQWEADRAKKAEFKRNRAIERAERDLSAALSKHKSHLLRQTPGSLPSDIDGLHSRMRQFAVDTLGDTSLSLPPMSKKSRVAVHLLAEVYGLKSKSMGKGDNRFPVLERTAKTAVARIDEGKVRAILGSVKKAAGKHGDGSAYDIGRGGSWGGKAKGKMGALWDALEGDGKKSGKTSGALGNGGARNREGHVVGVGAEKVGAGNVGFQLLQRMGWKEGDQIGVQGGIAEPITARIKTTKSGLGSGYALTRAEATAFVVNTNAGNEW